MEHWLFLGYARNGRSGAFIYDLLCRHNLSTTFCSAAQLFVVVIATSDLKNETYSDLPRLLMV